MTHENGSGRLSDSASGRRNALRSTPFSEGAPTACALMVCVGAPSHSTAAVLIHAENAERNHILGSIPFENVFILVPVFHHILDGET